jgi:transcriptional regulator GlxA family with amidase domain
MHWRESIAHWHSCHWRHGTEGGRLTTMRCEVLIYDGFDELDALAPWEVLEGVARERDDLDTALVSLDGDAPVRASHGTVVMPHRALSEHVDMLVVPGGGWRSRSKPGAWTEYERGVIPDAIRGRHEGGALVASVCTGAMLLAAAGLLDGRPAITHHSAISDLEAAGAKVIHARVVDDGDVVTAGGVTSGLDLVLHLVERYFGAPLALAAEHELEYERRGTVWSRARVSA